jgi:1-deoxy-D-xylulose-5-phosphate reductoisomerase
MSMPRGIAILGSTGSIGRSTLAVIALHPDAFKVAVLGAFSSWQVIVEQAKAFHPEIVVLVDEEAAAKARAALRDCGSATQVESGERALSSAVSAANVHMVMAAIVGAAGLQPTLAAVRAGKRVFLANKEALVMTGRLLMDEVRRAGAQLIPIDSEHNAIFQCMPAGYLPGDPARGVTRVILTASGGPFRTATLAEMQFAPPEAALRHPIWSMGAKISIDSATMMNKGLELIEAARLFNLAETQVDVLVHPQSVVHGLVCYSDGSVLAQLGTPDMRIPIAHALAWPERLATNAPRLDLAAVAKLEFAEPDIARFPALRLARDALRAGGGTPTILSAANEVAVEAFLQRRIGFLDIARTVETVLDRLGNQPAETLDEVLALDQAGRRAAGQVVELITATWVALPAA